MTHYPNPPSESAPTISPSAVEKILSDWFEQPVVLLGSGRAGIYLYMKTMGLERYRDHILVPPYLSACVTDTLGRCAFPVKVGEKPEMTLLYHQYGLPQQCRPRGLVLEDICHQFFGTPSSGAREWVGGAAVFSIPKFFGIAGMGGGIVAHDDGTAKRIRDLRDESQAELPGIRAWMRRVIGDSYRNPSASKLAPLMESAYALLTAYPRSNAADLRGFPKDVARIREIGKKRSSVVASWFDALEKNALPLAILENLERCVPFAFPYFGNGDRDWLADRNAELLKAGVHAGVYNVDIAMNMDRPEYRSCILLPCHQDVSERHIDTISRIIRG